jgi:hypothetical protein
MKNKYVTYINDSKGFNLFEVLSDDGRELKLQATKNASKFPVPRNKVELFWLQRENRVKYGTDTYVVHKIIWAMDTYYVELQDADSGEYQEESLETVEAEFLLL